jgi:hypothetical protein
MRAQRLSTLAAPAMKKVFGQMIDALPLPKNNLNRMLMLIGAVIVLITIFAQYRGPDCESGTTDSFSPDLREDQIAFLEKNFPEDFDSRSKSDETLLGIIRFADPFSQATSTSESERKVSFELSL